MRVSATFLSTLSLRRATIHGVKTHKFIGDFYPRSPCGERLIPLRSRLKRAIISIHALLAESDQLTLVQGFSCWIFLSTLSLRRATGVVLGQQMYNADFYPRSPCGERLPAGAMRLPTVPFLSTLSLRRATLCNCLYPMRAFISIHALLAESDV